MSLSSMTVGNELAGVSTPQFDFSLLYWLRSQ